MEVRNAGMGREEQHYEHGMSSYYTYAHLHLPRLYLPVVVVSHLPLPPHTTTHFPHTCTSLAHTARLIHHSPRCRCWSLYRLPPMHFICRNALLPACREIRWRRSGVRSLPWACARTVAAPHAAAHYMRRRAWCAPRHNRRNSNAYHASQKAHYAPTCLLRTRASTLYPRLLPLHTCSAAPAPRRLLHYGASRLPRLQNNTLFSFSAALPATPRLPWYGSRIPLTSTLLRCPARGTHRILPRMPPRRW